MAMEVIYDDKDGLNGFFKNVGKFVTKNVKSAAKDIKKNVSIKNVAALAPVATSFIPGIGPIASAAIKSGSGIVKNGVNVKSLVSAGTDLAGAGAFNGTKVNSALVKIKDSKAGQLADKLSHTKVGAFVVNQGGKILTPIVSDIKAQIKVQGGKATAEQVKELQAISDSVQAKIASNPDGATKQKILESLDKASVIPDAKDGANSTPTPAQINAIAQAKGVDPAAITVGSQTTKDNGSDSSSGMVMPILAGAAVLGGLYMAFKK